MGVVERLMMDERHATPYHAPVYLAQKMGFFEEQGIKVALLEPNDPSGISPLTISQAIPKAQGKL